MAPESFSICVFLAAGAEGSRAKKACPAFKMPSIEEITDAFTFKGRRYDPDAPFWGLEIILATGYISGLPMDRKGHYVLFLDAQYDFLQTLVLKEQSPATSTFYNVGCFSIPMSWSRWGGHDWVRWISSRLRDSREERLTVKII